MLTLSKQISNLTTIVISKNDLTGLNQTLKSFRFLSGIDPKLILVLTDYTSQNIEDLRKEYFSLNPEIYEVESEGPYSAMNYGLEKTNTDYVNFLHGGDTYSEDTSILELLNSMKDSLVGFGRMEIINPVKLNRKVYSFDKYRNILHRLGLKYIPHPATIVSTHAAKSVGGFDLNYYVAADQKMLIQLAHKCTPVINSKVVSNFKLGGLSTRPQIEIVRDFQRMSREIYGYFFGNRFLDSCIWKLNIYYRVIASSILKHWK